MLLAVHRIRLQQFARATQLAAGEWVTGDEASLAAALWDAFRVLPSYLKSEREHQVVVSIALRICAGVSSRRIASMCDVPLAQSRNRRESVNRALWHIRRNCCKREMDLRRTCTLAERSPYHLSRMINCETGYGFHTHLAGWRVLHAARALAVTDDSIKEVAYITGFGSGSELDRQFGQWLRMPPGHFRLVTRRLGFNGHLPAFQGFRLREAR